ncbi:Eco57I restriction-modification methylase domain-containing protein [Vibrio comitans]|uniref:site-specific DNA-methyltransferase (adenine-specific) n=1 Tax=Vibrio comitans NBRC 102076 TaxID=1219078 RepID=A0A4Y3IJB9_9VIBR|nr:Eco57I restriction-modification methylase domain-containing protein [Vibrio comitans]GEA59609.1 type II DNA modification methyltransferase [Vibrio comitans NBRC 102076]
MTVQQCLHSVSLEWGSSNDEKGEVFTKPTIVDYMLDVVEVCDALFNPSSKILEPSCGQGEFVIALTKKLVNKVSTLQQVPAYDYFVGKIFAFDISSVNIAVAKQKVRNELVKIFSTEEAHTIADSWFYCEDFLLWESAVKFTHVVGNPPYVRIENIPSLLLEEYRANFVTMTDRADLYVAFYEKSLELLVDGGQLIYICTDRWMKNRYGRNLRNLIHKSYNLRMILDLYGQRAFQSEVLTYPAITLIEKSRQSETLLIHGVGVDDLSATSTLKLMKDRSKESLSLHRNDVVKKDFPWLLGGSDEINLIQRLEARFPCIEDVGCNVSIGVATGNNKVFVIDDGCLVEDSRRVPMITAADIRSGELSASGKFMINTFDENGVIDLAEYPRLEEYLNEHFEVLSTRHVAKKKPENWFRTIDRLHADKAQSEKLLIPDIKSRLTVIHDTLGLQPNNSIYYIISKYWDMRALKLVLESGVGQLFIENYSTKVSGGNLRFQAQHLRRIRLPSWNSLTSELQEQLIESSLNNGQNITQLMAELYELTDKDLQLLGLQ